MEPISIHSILFFVLCLTAVPILFATGAESIRITFDPEKLTYADMLSMFLSFHTPANPRWAGTQYRSAIFVHNDKQRGLAELALKGVGGKIAQWIAIEDASDFYRAEEYHQKYLDKLTI